MDDQTAANLEKPPLPEPGSVHQIASQIFLRLFVVALALWRLSVRHSRTWLLAPVIAHSVCRLTVCCLVLANEGKPPFLAAYLPGGTTMLVSYVVGGFLYVAKGRRRLAVSWQTVQLWQRIVFVVAPILALPGAGLTISGAWWLIFFGASFAGTVLILTSSFRSLLSRSRTSSMSFRPSFAFSLRAC